MPESHPLFPAVERHQSRLYGFALCLAAGNEDRAYELASNGLAEALRAKDLSGLLASAARRIVHDAKKSGDAPAAMHPGGAEPPIMRFVRAAVYSLPFDSRALILLRDQLNLSYRQIASIVGTGQDEARRATVAARSLLRERIAEEVRRA